MKKVMNVVLAAAAVAVMAVPAIAAEKLVVKDNLTPANTVFKVESDGAITGGYLDTTVVPNVYRINNYWNPTTKKYGFGTANPKTSLHLVEQTAPFDRGLTIAQHNDSIAAAVINIKKSYGSEAVPAIPDKAGVNVAAFHAQVYDGNTTVANANGYSANASFVLFTEPAAAYSAGNIPTAIKFTTGVSQAGNIERFRVASDGRIRMSNQPAAPANNAVCTKGDMILDATSGILYLCTIDNPNGTVVAWKRTSFASY